MTATLTIPDLDESVERKLRARADRHGHSVEAEAREILIRAVASGESAPVENAAIPLRQPFLELAGAVEGTPDLSGRHGFQA